MTFVNIKRIMKKQSMGNKELSEKSGIPLGTLNKIIYGETTNPSLDTMKAIAKALECSLDDFVDDDFKGAGGESDLDDFTEYLDELRYRPEMRMLFSVSKKASKEDVEKAVRSKGDRPAETKKHYLSGILKCGSCGSTLSYAQATDGFQCIKYAHGVCKPSHYIKAGKIEEAILGKLSEVAMSGSYIENIRTIDENTEKVDLIQKELGRLEKIMDRVSAAYLNGIDSLEDYGRNKKIVQKEIDRVKESLAEAQSRVKSVDQVAFRKQVREIMEILASNASIPTKNSALKNIVEKIVFSRPEGTISIYFYMQL